MSVVSRHGRRAGGRPVADPTLTAPFLLVAGPALQDPNFRRTVVLVISHDAEGTYGLVLNRGLEQTLADVLSEEDERAAGVPLLQGGPVQGEVLQLLGDGPGAEVFPGVSALPVGEDLETLLAMLPDTTVARAYLGYAGWGTDQLIGELEEGAWIVADPQRKHVFEIPPDRLWVSVLWELGGSYRWLALEGGDPTAN